MAKIENVGSISDFLSGDYKRKQKEKDIEVIKKVLKASGTALVILLPKTAYAAAGDLTFNNIHKKIMLAFDWGIVLVIIFAGAAWALGHRTKAIEMLIGVCCGYILARHAVDLRDLLKSI